MKLKKYLPALLWAGFVFVLSIIPGKDLPHFSWAELITIDKWAHLFVYGVLTWLLLWCANAQVRDLRLIVLMISLSALLGMTMEWVQGTFCADRTFDWLDELANTIGAILGAVFFVSKITKRKIVR